MSNETTWIERLRRAASRSELDAETYRQRMETAKGQMEKCLADRDGFLNAVQGVLDAEAIAAGLED